MLQTEINYIETILIILYLNVSSNLDFYFLILESCGIMDVIKKLSFYQMSVCKCVIIIFYVS